MDDLSTRERSTEEAEETQPAAQSVRRLAPRIVFAVASVAFLVYLAIGTAEARIWRFGRLYFEDRDVRHVWGYLGDHLPDLPGKSLITGLYWISLIVMAVGVILGLWLFLGTHDDDPASEAPIMRPEQSAPDA